MKLFLLKKNNDEKFLFQITFHSIIFEENCYLKVSRQAIGGLDNLFSFFAAMDRMTIFDYEVKRICPSSLSRRQHKAWQSKKFLKLGEDKKITADEAFNCLYLGKKKE